ncbi:hypothetical protein HYU20_01890 [Candidatus Woesearchaeota archaeon]|nr:hypothetical protein [Candidatus Woesearchaeota archaeon]
MGSSDGFYQSNGRNLPRSSLPDGRASFLETVTAAAVDESVEGGLFHVNSTYLTIVCSPPRTLLRMKRKPSVHEALQNQAKWGLVVATKVLPAPPSGADYWESWRKGVEELVAEVQQADSPMRWFPIGQLYVDGRKQDELRDALRERGIDTIFGRKYRRSGEYRGNLGLFGEYLLHLADTAAGIARISSNGHSNGHFTNGITGIITT